MLIDTSDVVAFTSLQLGTVNDKNKKTNKKVIFITNVASDYFVLTIFIVVFLKFGFSFTNKNHCSLETATNNNNKTSISCSKPFKLSFGKGLSNNNNNNNNCSFQLSVEFEANRCNWCQVRENTCSENAIGFGFASHWLRK